MMLDGLKKLAIGVLFSAGAILAPVLGFLIGDQIAILLGVHLTYLDLAVALAAVTLYFFAAIQIVSKRRMKAALLRRKQFLQTDHQALASQQELYLVELKEQAARVREHAGISLRASLVAGAVGLAALVICMLMLIPWTSEWFAEGKAVKVEATFAGFAGAIAELLALAFHSVRREARQDMQVIGDRIHSTLKRLEALRLLAAHPDEPEHQRIRTEFLRLALLDSATVTGSVRSQPDSAAATHDRLSARAAPMVVAR